MITKYLSLENFTRWIIGFHKEIECHHHWKHFREPFPNFDENDCILLEWNGKDSKRLTIYFDEPEGIWYLKSWKDFEKIEMEDGSRSLNESCLDLWVWLWG